MKKDSRKKENKNADTHTIEKNKKIYLGREEWNKKNSTMRSMKEMWIQLETLHKHKTWHGFLHGTQHENNDSQMCLSL